MEKNVTNETDPKKLFKIVLESFEKAEIYDEFIEPTDVVHEEYGQAYLSKHDGDFGVIFEKSLQNGRKLHTLIGLGYEIMQRESIADMKYVRDRFQEGIVAETEKPYFKITSTESTKSGVDMFVEGFGKMFSDKTTKRKSKLKW